MKKTSKLKRTVQVTLLFLASGLVYNNCTPGALDSVSDYQYDSGQQASSYVEPVVDAGPPSTWRMPADGVPARASLKAIPNFEQVFQSMLTLTDQSKTPTTGMVNTYNAVSGAMPEGSDPKMLNGPAILAMNSLGGDVCNGLISNEEKMAIEKRKFFGAVDFTKGTDQLTEEKLMAAAGVLSRNFMARPLSANEATLVKTYRTEFITALTAAEKAQARQSRNLVLSLCAALLSSFDAMTL